MRLGRTAPTAFAVEAVLVAQSVVPSDAPTAHWPIAAAQRVVIVLQLF
jgi:hypothetical protein